MSVRPEKLCRFDIQPVTFFVNARQKRHLPDIEDCAKDLHITFSNPRPLIKDDRVLGSTLL